MFRIWLNSATPREHPWRESVSTAGAASASRSRQSSADPWNPEPSSASEGAEHPAGASIGVVESHRQLLEGANSGAPAPLYSPRLDGKAHFRKAGEDALERDRCLRPSKLKTKAETHAGAAGEVWVGMTPDVEPVRLVLELRRIAIRRRQKCRHHLTAEELVAHPSHIAGRKTRLGDLHRRDIAQAFLDAGWHPGVGRAAADAADPRARTTRRARR